ncbi:radical SAM protein [Planctomycetota bacterium]
MESQHTKKAASIKRMEPLRQEKLGQSTFNDSLQPKHPCSVFINASVLLRGKVFTVYEWGLMGGIIRTRGFEKKGLAKFGVNCGLKCGNLCTYCFTGVTLRTHKAFKELGLNPFRNDYAIIDPDTVARVARDAAHISKRGVVQLCTFVDAWGPVAQEYSMGRGCLKAILSQSDWIIRILTKNREVVNDFDLIEKHADRVMVGLSMTATPDKAEIMSIVEPNASSNLERRDAMEEAHRRGFRTYAMLCPLLPGIADAPFQIEELIRFAVKCGAEEIFVEPVNLRGPGLELTKTALANQGYMDEAAAIEGIRTNKGWSRYALQLISNVQHTIRKLYDIRRLRILLYPSRLTEKDVARIREDDAGVVWLGND